jgi:hypothetical protein
MVQLIDHAFETILLIYEGPLSFNIVLQLIKLK